MSGCVSTATTPARENCLSQYPDARVTRPGAHYHLYRQSRPRPVREGRAPLAIAGNRDGAIDPEPMQIPSVSDRRKNQQEHWMTWRKWGENTHKKTRSHCCNAIILNKIKINSKIVREMHSKRSNDCGRRKAKRKRGKEARRKVLLFSSRSPTIDPMSSTTILL